MRMTFDFSLADLRYYLKKHSFGVLYYKLCSVSIHLNVVQS